MPYLKRSHLPKKSDTVYTGQLTDISSLFTWVYEHCIPLVREITFQNGEEMTEEGLPLLILFYHPDDPSVKEVFKQRVEAELKEHRGKWRGSELEGWLGQGTAKRI